MNHKMFIKDDCVGCPNAICGTCDDCYHPTVVNTNKEPPNLTGKWRLEDQVQRLQTYNMLLSDLLRELVSLTEPDLSDTHNECLKKCEKALATKEQS